MKTGYGSIYNSTWWGEGEALDNTIGFGYAYRHIQLTEVFKRRIVADGGSLTSFECVSESLYRLIHNR